MNPHVCALLGFEPCPARIDWAAGPGWLVAYLVIAFGVVLVMTAKEREP